MQSLPYDVIHMIVSQLQLDLRSERRRDWTPFLLSPYAGVCKSWNSAIEHKTFRILFLNLKKLDYAEQVLSNDPTRRSIVREIYFSSHYSCSLISNRDLSYKQVSERDEAFSWDVSRLFGFLAAGEAGNRDIERFRSMYLEISPCADRKELPEEYDFESEGLEDDYMDQVLKYDPAFLRYVGATLPTIYCVKEFELKGDGR